MSMLVVAATLALVALAAAPIVVALAAGRSSDAPGAKGPASREADARASIEDARRAKQNYFRGHSFSPLRAFARYDFPPFEPGREPAAIVGAAEGADVRLDAQGIAPEQMRITALPRESEGGPFRFRLERLAPGGDVRVDGEPLPDEGPEATRIVPEETKIAVGPFAIRPYVQAEAGILILFDSRLTEGKHFVPPAHFPVDLAWRFHVPLVRVPEPETIGMQTSLGRVKEYRRVGYFEIDPPHGSGGDDKKVRIFAYQPTFAQRQDEALSILFTDLTTGKETYPAGRYIDLAPPADGLYTLDFNAAYNPLCAYTDVYNCPLPPRENALPVAVRAGELNYPGRKPH
jgi:hypothetical protein